jgi:hypothetical protein
MSLTQGCPVRAMAVRGPAAALVRRARLDRTRARRWHARRGVIALIFVSM